MQDVPLVLVFLMLESATSNKYFLVDFFLPVFTKLCKLRGDIFYRIRQKSALNFVLLNTREK